MIDAGQKVAQFDQATARRKEPAKGHEIPLSSMIKHGYDAILTLTNGDVIKGVVTSFDKFTITVHSQKHQWPITYFKHAIESFTRVA